MSYGFEILAADNGAIISDRTSNLVYIGAASFSSAWCAHSLADVYGNRKNFWQLTYYVSCASKPFAYAEAPVGAYVGVETVMANGPGSWKITVGVGGYQYSYDFQPKIYCFTKIPIGTAPSGYGLVVYAADGSIQFDSSNGYKYLQTTNIFTAASPPGLNNKIPTDTGVSLIPGVIPVKVASSYSVNAKGTTSGYYSGLYNLALGSRNGSAQHLTQWFALAPSSYQDAWGIYDGGDRVVSYINAAYYD